MKVWKCVGVLFLWLFAARGSAQDSLSKFSFSGYVEAYYSYDLNKPDDKFRPPFFYSFNKHNQPNVNIAMVKGSYGSERFRANLGIMAGTYSRYNLAQEPEALRYLYEANIGFRIGKKDLWLDVGLLPSHIGIESAIGKDYISLTRSIMADNSPYFETGARLGYSSDNGKWYAAFLILNGWQRIKPIEGNSLPSFGHQLQFKPNDKILLNSSSFIGTDKPDAERKMRYFHNLYGIVKLSDRVDLQMAFDIGVEQKAKGSSDYNTWSAVVGGIRYRIGDRLTSGTLLEYYSDKDGVLTTTDTGLGLETFGFSETISYQLGKRFLLRGEWRWLNGRQKIYLNDGIPSYNNNALTTSVSFAL